MTREELLLSLRSALQRPDAASFPAVVEHNHPADVAATLDELEHEPAQICSLLRSLATEPRAELFGHLPPPLQVEVAVCMDRSELAELFLHMSPDDRADVFNRLPEDQREAFLPALAQVEREDIRRLAAYEEGTVGATMTSDYATVPPYLSAREAVEHLRSVAPDRETIYQAFVIDDERRIVGTVSLKDLIVAPPYARVSDFMERDVITIGAESPREEAARLISKYDLIALPVVDTAERLIGIVTYDDAMDVAEAEATEDFHRVGGLGELAVGIRDATIAALYRKRIFWLVVLVFGNLLSGAGIAYFEDTIATYVALVFFLPLLIGSGGNAGAQAATLMVRALATGEVVLKDWAAMLGRELVVAGLLGATMSLAVVWLGLWRGGAEIALVVAMTMQLVVVAGSVIGMSLPFILSRFQFDPATASAPLITTIADATGVVLYLGIATAVLGLPAQG
ncbi:MAG TPA: magnesium transporter [Burkholderiaceae bacterium]|jgi:magnesium transporter|nr:magnesium transporter [Burkholderiaceae bacterium]